MAEPQIYDAAGEALKASTAYARDYVPPPQRLEERDAIWNFEQVPGAMQEQTDLRGWMLRQKDARIELVKGWSRELSKREGEDPTATMLRRQKVKRRLLFVIGTEASHASGSRDVAAEAFKAIFPKE